MSVYSDQSKQYLQELVKLIQKGIGGKTNVIKAPITTTAGAYTAGDNVGGVITLTDAVDAQTGTGILQYIHLKETTNNKLGFEILIFDRHPVTVGGATCTDNRAFAYGSSMPYQVARFSIAAGDYTTLDTKASATSTSSYAPVKSLTGNTLYAVAVTTGAPTYAANSTTLEIDFGFLKD